jgi:chitin disaccharide deacetylase
MERYLIVNADDFGLSPGVSRGILEAHRDGILTSTTFMVNFPWATECAAMLRDAPGLGVGIHLNLTTGRPVLPPEQVPSLITADGTLSKSLFRLRFRARPEEVRREWEAQVRRGIELLGRQPTHLDSHGFTHSYPPFAQAVIEIARTLRIPAVRILRPGPDVPGPGSYRGWTPFDLVYRRYLSASARAIEASGLCHPDRTVVGNHDGSSLLRRLEKLEPGVTELVCHPGRVDELLSTLTSFREQREVELAALKNPEVRRLIDFMQIRLVSFSHLVA